MNALSGLSCNTLYIYYIYDSSLRLLSCMTRVGTTEIVRSSRVLNRPACILVGFIRYRRACLPTLPADTVSYLSCRKGQRTTPYHTSIMITVSYRCGRDQVEAGKSRLNHYAFYKRQYSRPLARRGWLYSTCRSSKFGIAYAEALIDICIRAAAVSSSQAFSIAQFMHV